MGGAHPKEQKHSHSDHKKSDQMKDEYVKFIRREQLRREKEFKEKSHDKEGIYLKIKSNSKKEDASILHEDQLKAAAAKKSSKPFSNTIKKLQKTFSDKRDVSPRLSPTRGNRISNTIVDPDQSISSSSNHNSTIKSSGFHCAFFSNSKIEKVSSQLNLSKHDSLEETLNSSKSNSSHPQSFKIERISDDPSESIKIQELTSKKDMEWIVILMGDLRKMGDKEFAEPLINTLQTWLDKGKSKLDPKEFRTLYIKKISQDKTNSKKHGRHVSMGNFTQKKFHGIGGTGSQVEINPFEQKEDLAVANDLIGLSFYSVSDQYKRKFLTLHSHLQQFDHHPIKKLMDEFRRWLEDFMKEKNQKIKQAASMFQKENTLEYMKEQIQKLLEVIVDYVKEFVKLASKAMVLFYQLDVVSGEITEVCLYNLLSSLVLKNPIYTKVIDLFRTAHRDMIQQIEIQIESVQDRRWDFSHLLGINEIEIGRHILHYSHKQQQQQQQLEEVIEEEESSQYSEVYNQQERESYRDTFEKTLKKILYVKNHSSPTAKIEYISKLFTEIIPGTGQQAADFVLNLFIFCFLCLGKRSADLYIEQQYIQSFSHEEMIDKIDEYQHISQIHTALTQITSGIEQFVNNLQQGVGSRSMSLASHSNEYSNSSDRKRSSFSGESNNSNDLGGNRMSRNKNKKEMRRKSTFNEIGVPSLKRSQLQNELITPTSEQRTQSSARGAEVARNDQEYKKQQHCLSPDHLPKANFVEDQDYDLNKDRTVLANIRQDVQSWATRLTYNNTDNGEQLQSLAQGAVVDEDDMGLLKNIRDIERNAKQEANDFQKMILTTTGSIFKKLVDRTMIDEEEMQQIQSFDQEFLGSLINQQRRLQEEIKEEDE